MDDKRIESYEAEEMWMHGMCDEHPDRQCPNCSVPVDRDRIEEPDPDDGLLLCPECGAELPWEAIAEVPANDWFNWACLQKLEYAARACFDEPEQRALRLDVSAADPRGGDVGLEITKDSSGNIVVKVENRESFTYYRYVDTTKEGSYTVVRFEPI